MKIFILLILCILYLIGLNVEGIGKTIDVSLGILFVLIYIIFSLCEKKN